MALPVIVKSTKRGIQLVLDSEIPYEVLIEKIQEKFKSTKEFFQDASFSVSFSGRVLSKDQENEIINIITESSHAEVLCILEENELLDEYITEKLEQIAIEKRMKCGQFHKGDINAGQTLECEHSVVVLGNVYKGGKVISKGNIVVLGSLKGYAFAGASGRNNTFISALDIDSTQLKIADYCLRSTKVPFGGIQEHKKSSPQIAKAKDKTIIIEPLTSGFLNDI